MTTAVASAATTRGEHTMNNDPSLRKADETDTEGHVRFLLDEQGNPDVASPDDEDTEGHKRRD
jgi:hypothetical protein